VLIDFGDRTTEVDCLWREQRLIVELDGHEVHGTRAAFESDRERDRHLQAAGWTVVRLTWRQLEDEPEAICADLRRLLGVHAENRRTTSEAAREVPLPPGREPPEKPMGERALAACPRSRRRSLLPLVGLRLLGSRALRSAPSAPLD